VEDDLAAMVRVAGATLSSYRAVPSQEEARFHPDTHFPGRTTE
jgi:hypothetical protein